VDSGYLKVFPHGTLVKFTNAFQRDSGRLDDLRSRPYMLEHSLVHEAPRPDDHVCRPDKPRSP
jgi:hypothetical protein